MSADPGGPPSGSERRGDAHATEAAGPWHVHPGPLSGLRIVDCSTVLAGPYCTMVLGDLGADVIKVEPPGGDVTRTWGPPWVGDDPKTRVAAYFLSVNRNKRSVVLDLRTDADRDLLRALIRDADVLVENRPDGGFARLRFDDDTLAALRPGLVHLNLSGFGNKGPARAQPGFDFIIQALAGVMSFTGTPDAEGGVPTKVGVAISDLTTGLFAAVGILSALRARDGEPREAPPLRRVDVSLYASTLAWLANQGQNQLVTGRDPVRMGNAHPSIAPYETFAARDGALAVAVGTEGQWKAFTRALGDPALAEDPRFRTNADRVANRAALRTRIEQRLCAGTVSAWQARFTAENVPVGEIRGIGAALADPRTAALGMLHTFADTAWGELPVIGSPLAFGDTHPVPWGAPPALDAHRDEIVRALRSVSRV